jgi:hypothetical protein
MVRTPFYPVPQGAEGSDAQVDFSIFSKASRLFFRQNACVAGRTISEEIDLFPPGIEK